MDLDGHGGAVELQFSLLAQALGWTPPSSTCGLPSTSSITPVSTPDMTEVPMDNEASGGLSAMDLEDNLAKASDRASSTNDIEDTTPRYAQRQLCLGNGTILSFTEEEVSDPPAISFADDIPRLVRMWDDTFEEWDPKDCVLHIQEQPIALVHWRDVYRYGKKKQWKGMLNKWTEWQVAV